MGEEGLKVLTMADSSEPVVAQIEHPETTQILQSFDGCDVVVRQVQKVQSAWERTTRDPDCTHKRWKKSGIC